MVRTQTFHLCLKYDLQLILVWSLKHRDLSGNSFVILLSITVFLPDNRKENIYLFVFLTTVSATFWTVLLEM